jgi:polar amino acid transport system permease protein
VKKFLAYFFSIISFLVFFGFVVFQHVIRRNRELNFLPLFDDYGLLLISGFWTTIWVSVLVLVLSSILGFLLYLIAQSKFDYGRAMVNVFTEIIYGTPLLVMVVLMAFLIGPAFNTYNRPLLGILGLILYIAPYMKNVFVSAFSTITKDQVMAMDLFGFNSFQRYRYLIFPQVIRALMPPLMNNFSLIIKGSALLYVLAFNELYNIITIIQYRTFLFVEGYLLLWMLYLCITIPLSQLSNWLERKFRT